MKISPGEMSSAESLVLEEISVKAHSTQVLSEITKPIIDGYNDNFSPVVNRPFVIFLSALLLFVGTLLYFTS